MVLKELLALIVFLTVLGRITTPDPVWTPWLLASAPFCAGLLFIYAWTESRPQDEEKLEGARIFIRDALVLLSGLVRTR